MENGKSDWFAGRLASSSLPEIMMITPISRYASRKQENKAAGDGAGQRHGQGTA
jgi:hypothetical protein